MGCNSTCLPAHLFVPDDQNLPSTVFAITLKIQRAFGSKSIFLARSIDLTCASHLYGANSSGQCFARWISFYNPIFSDIDYGRYLRKFTTNQV